MASPEEGPLMSATAVFVTSIGVISSVITIVMNVYFIKKIERTRQKMILFFYRLFLDVAYNVLACAYMTFCIVYSFFTDELHAQQVFILYVGFPLQTAGAMRTIVAVTMSIERVLAIYTPIMFHNYRHLCPSIIILILAIGLAMLENLILYLFCTLNISAIPRDCGVLRCSLDNCYFNYWTTDRSVLFALNFAFSGLLSTRLLLFNKKHNHNAGEEHTKINHIALIDAANVFLCDFLPTFSNYVNDYPFFSFKNIGPYVYIIKLVGSAVESYFIFKVLKRRSARSSVVVITRTFNS
ncbi:Serpentine Receptor, class BC (Class B-like) [Caenorhabditis elegans]|uniref:Serpentine Receptor, class BC (Class B-like) n=1 Tax=Caenorhabditis elegans TaxID=6239 RepID=O76681_CAEEL|nr:Serpentine Receptor, class BC (Class B-like) [Caenorhabditis elegans]CCD62926.1 Serpentine Receptor, class BC (Class B-like) [Caenorhabditis elegans]|eukprot:NP_503940.2 Serpentine Receptor, class BC (class B-like) [Caenorhabditis elegans]